MTLSRTAKMLLLTTVLSAAMVACGDDDGTGGGGGGAGGAGGGVGGAGGGVGGAGGGVGGGTAMISARLRVAQLILDARFSPTGDAGMPASDAGITPPPGVRICLKVAGNWSLPLPQATQSPIGIPAGSISAYNPAQTFPAGAIDVAIYPVPSFDAATPTNVADPCGAAETAGVDPILTDTIDPAAENLVDGGFYTILLSGLIDPSPTGLTNMGGVPCKDALGADTNCPGPQLTILHDQVTPTSATQATIRVVNAVPNGGAVVACSMPANLATMPPMPTGAPTPILAATAAVTFGSATDYVDRAEITANSILNAITQPPAAPSGDGGPADAGVIDPCIAGLPAAASTVPTPAPITATYNAGNMQATALSALSQNHAISIFLVGVVDANPLDGPGAGMIPIDDAAP